MRLELSRRAPADLDDIRDYSLAEFGVGGAIVYLDAVEGAFRRIPDFPEMGALQAMVSPPTRSLGLRQHRLYYAVEDDRIVVLRILHKAMDAARHL